MSIENNKKQLCQLCNNQLNNNESVCPHCGWVQQLDLDETDKIHWSYNFVSYSKAKNLLSEGKPLIPDYTDFLKCMEVYSELEFFINDNHFGIITDADKKIHFYKWNEMDTGYQIYSNIREFGNNATINGVLLKNLWNQVTKFGTAS